jgi:tetratricopeptide (TPR) repeat protein
VRQSNHEFPAALADLDVLVAETPDDPEPWLVRAVVLGVLGRYTEAQRDCERTGALAGGFVAAVCLATPLGMSGRGDEARRAVLRVLAGSRSLGSAERAWGLSTLAELEVSLGLRTEARRHFDAALALAPNDPYTLAAYADFELDLGEPRRALELVERFERIDALLLRLVLAEHRLQLPSADERARELGARYAAARLRGDVTHRREEARYVLEIAGDSERALELARANWDVQKERGDARVLLEAARAAERPSAARPVAEFLARTGAKDETLRALLERLGGAS